MNTFLSLTSLHFQLSTLIEQLLLGLPPLRNLLQRIEEVETAIKSLYNMLKTSHATWISYSSLDYARDQLRANLQKLIRALQAAHHRRLSIDLLNSDTLKKLFDAAARKARSHHHQ